MKTLDYLHLDASAVSNVVASLKQLLADYQVFYTNLRGFHWNIKGHGFFVLHGKFEDMYNNAAEKVDELAERILMLGGEPENKFSEYLKVARVKEVSGVSCGDEALKHILDTYGLLIGEERKLLSLASEAGDEATVALMSDYLKEQEKLVWMLAAYSTCDCICKHVQQCLLYTLHVTYKAFVFYLGDMYLKLLLFRFKGRLHHDE
jgi:starvation-inducible DNA-binding protein